jgi:hypothetical protein
VPVLEVDGVGDVDVVFDRVRQAIKKLAATKPRARGI